MNRRSIALAAAAASAAAVGGVVIVLAQADPSTPDGPTPTPALGASCAEALDGAVTALPAQPGDPSNRKNLLKCSDGSWQTFAAEYPSSDLWLSNDAGLQLHGQGVRNAEFMAGTWTGTPQQSDGVCTAEYEEVVAPSEKKSETRTVNGEPGKPTTFEAPVWMPTVELTGDCLWQRS